MVGLPAKGINAQRFAAPCGKRALVWAAVLAAAAVALDFVPLFNLLGYDFSFVIGLFTAFAAVDLGHGAVASARRAAAPHAPAVTTLVARATVTSLALLAPPLVFSLLNALRVRNCGLATGLAFYALLPVATAIFAAPAGVVAALVFPQRGRIVALSLPLLSFVWAGLRLYGGPAVYALDPFGGYFPGPIYDEALLPPPRLWQFRLGNLLWAAALVAAASVVTRREGPGAPVIVTSGRALWKNVRALRPERQVALLVLCVSALFVFLQRGPLGFHRSHAQLAKELSRTHVTPHFEVHRSPADGLSPEELKLFLRELEFRYHQLARILGAEPKRPVKVFLFPDAETKKDLVGAGATLFTKPWQQEIYLQVESFPPQNLRHELAHIFASAFGDPIFGISLRWLPFPRLASGLVEGVAEAADYTTPDGHATLHQDARSIVEDGRAPPLRQIVGAGFTTVAGARAYTLAASFSRFLLDEHGAEKLRRVYASAGDFTAVYGRSLAELERDWMAFLTRQPVNERQRATAKERYRRPAIFKKVCARELAARVAEASKLRADEPDKAVALMRSVCDADPDEPTYVLSLAYAQAAAGLTEEALRTLAALERDQDLTVPLQRRVANFRSVLELTAGRLQGARDAERQALTLATEEGDLRSSRARLRALEDPRAQATLGRVLFGDKPTLPLDTGLMIYLLTTFAQQHPDEALGDYLLGRQLVPRDPQLALSHLGQACPDDPQAERPVPLDSVFRLECLRLRGEAGYRAGRYAEARIALNAAQALAETEADRLRAGDALARLDWIQSEGAKLSLGRQREPLN